MSGRESGQGHYIQHQRQVVLLVQPKPSGRHETRDNIIPVGDGDIMKRQRKSPSRRLENSDMVDQPLLTIIVPSYNSQAFLSGTLDSILTQDFESFEVLLVDDGSTDASPLTAQTYATNDRRIRFLRNQRGKGVSGARNTGLDEARGEWVAFLDSDDLLSAKSLSTRFDFLSRWADCKILAAEHEYIDENGRSLVKRRFESLGLIEAARRHATILHGGFCLEQPIEFFLDHFPLIWTGSVLLHSSVIEQIGNFDENMSHGEDTKYWLQAALHNKVFFTDFVATSYRQRESSASSQTEKALKGAAALYANLTCDAEFSGVRKKIKHKSAIALNDLAYYYRERKIFSRALEFSAKSVLASPLFAPAWRNMVASMLRTT